jgi:hypothetical protein
MSDSQPQQLHERLNREDELHATSAPQEVKTAASTEQQSSQASPTSPQTPTFDPSQYQATLQGTPSSTFARTASA